MGGLWVYGDGREVPDTFLNAADYPGKWSLTIQSSQVNEHGPATMLRGTKATMILSDEWEGPRSRRRDFAEILPEQPYSGEFRNKWGDERLVLQGFRTKATENTSITSSTVSAPASARTVMRMWATRS